MASSSATGRGGGRQYELGYVVRLSSYNEVEAVILQPSDPSLYRGSLVHVYDAHQGAHYLGMIIDVTESEPHPAPDPSILDQVLSSIESSRTTSYYEALRALLSPGSPLTYTTTITARIRVLGRVCSSSNGMLRCNALPYPFTGNPVMSDAGRPPRPRSLVAPPDPAVLGAILGSCSEPAVLGELRQLPGVTFCLDLRRLNTHLAVVGQTGSGKTETVKRLVYEAVRTWLAAGAPNRGVLVMDVTGEYSGYPYTPPPPARTLLEALAAVQGLRVPSVTILVPYEPRITRLHALRQGLTELWSAVNVHLAAVTGGHPTPVLVLRPQASALAMMHPSLAAGTPGARRLRAPSLYALDARGVIHLLRYHPSLIVALPLPDSMPLELLLELGGFREDAEYTNLLYDVLESLGSTGIVPSITLLALIASRSLSITDPAQSASRLCSSLARGSRRPLSVLTHRYPRLRLSLRPLARFLAGYPPPGVNLYDELRRACSGNPRLLEARLSRLADALGRVEAAPTRSRGALERRLSRLARVASPLLDPRISAILAARVASSLTIVHLAPPSTGSTRNPVLHWLLHLVYTYVVRRYSRDRRLLVVAEEAHNLAPSREETFSRSVLERYAREGRKWGISLVIVTQRPVGVDPTVLSQAATLIALRLTNPEDVQAVRSASESITEEIVERLADLSPGEALVTGYALPERRIPVLARIRMV